MDVHTLAFEWTETNRHWLIEVPIRIVAYVIVALIVRVVLQRMIDRATGGREGQSQTLVRPLRGRQSGGKTAHGADQAAERRLQRAQTIGSVLKSTVSIVLLIWVVLAVLNVLGLNIAPFIASAGVLGLAIGFGAQTLVKDVISGFFLLFDNTIGSGDLITFNGQTATVEYIGLRLIKARTFDGEVLMIPAGEMRVFGNKSLGFARAIVNVGLSYEQDVAEALRVLEGVATEWSETDAAKAILIDDAAQVQGAINLGESSVDARIVAQVRPGEQFAAERDLRVLVKKRFDEHGIEIPFPRRTVYVRNEAGAPETDAAAAAGA